MISVDISADPVQREAVTTACHRVDQFLLYRPCVRDSFDTNQAVLLLCYKRGHENCSIRMP